MNFSSAPVPTPKHLRRCTTCGAKLICEPLPNTAIPCACKGELVVSPITVDDLLAERKRAADALETLATKCEDSADGNQNVAAPKAAGHMRALAKWIISGEGA